MNANNIITNEMTLEAQLAEIDKLMKKKQEEINVRRGLPVSTPVDPAELTICDGCE